MADAVDFQEQVRRRARGALPAPVDAPEGGTVGAEGGSGRGDAPPPPDEDLGLPPECPVIPLGRLGDTFYFLDALGQLQSYRAEKLTRMSIASLFGHKSHLLECYWPRLTQDKDTKEWRVSGWKPELGQITMVTACSRAGIWNPRDKVRGGGAWLGPDGELIWHLGGDVLIQPVAGERYCRDPGVIDGHVYPAGPKQLRPADAEQPCNAAGPAAALLDMLKTWRFHRADVDPVLLLGWIGAAFLGGALPWRPIVWITGGRGTGKSTLQKLIYGLFGKEGMIELADTSRAYIQQTLKYDSKPVFLDEAESNEDNRKINDMVALARIAASGGKIGRGGADHQGQEFVINSCFGFLSILIPSMLPADISRTAILSLHPLPSDQPEPRMSARQAETLGRKLRRRLLDQWKRADATIAAYRAAMQRAGHDARGQDVFGVLLACADLLLHDYPPDSDTLAGWSEKMKADGMAEFDIETNDEQACLNYLLTSRLENHKDRMQMSVGEWIRCAAASSASGEELPATVDVAQRVLGGIGLKVEYQGRPKAKWLAVGSNHRGLVKLFEGTRWAGRPGSTGVYVQALKRLPHELPRDEKGKVIPFYVGGATMRGFWLPIELCLPKSPKVKEFLFPPPESAEAGA